MVPEEGLEPTPEERCLKPPRLPFRHSGKILNPLIPWSGAHNLGSPHLETWLPSLFCGRSGPCWCQAPYYKLPSASPALQVPLPLAVATSHNPCHREDVMLCIRLRPCRRSQILSANILHGIPDSSLGKTLLLAYLCNMRNCQHRSNCASPTRGLFCSRSICQVHIRLQSHLSLILRRG